MDSRVITQITRSRAPHGARRPLLTSKRYEGESNLCQLAQARCLLARLVWVLYSAAASREALRAALSFSAHL